MKTMICERCSGEAPHTGAMQRFCAPCSEVRAQERKEAYRDKSNPAYRRAVARADSREAATRAAGRARSAPSASCISVDLSRHIGGPWAVRVAVPFDQAASKNYVFGTGGEGGHRAKRQAQNTFRANLTARVARLLRGERVAQNKVWIEILVQKPNHRSDAINVVHLICDAVKAAIGVDDRWFAIKRLDWEICKGEPRIVVGISQETTEDATACSYCGHLLPFEAFARRKHSKTGHYRVCMSCEADGRAAVDATQPSLLDAVAA